MASLRQRLFAGSGANALGQAVTIGIQLFSLPLFLLHWDIATYGAWLIISAIPTYLSMADVGMVTAAGNKMTMAVARKDFNSANTVFQSAIVFMLLICGLILSVVFFVCFLIPVSILNINLDQRIALAALSTGVVLSFFNGLAEAIFKANGKYAFGTILGNLIRLGEWCGAMVGLWLVETFSSVAFGALLMRILGIIFIIFLSRTEINKVRWGIHCANKSEIFEMAKPAISFMLIPVGFALSFQSVTILIGVLLGPAALALFNVYRTLARVAVQFTGVFSSTLWPEFSRLYGISGFSVVLPLYKRASKLGFILPILVSLALYIAAPTILKIWTRDAIHFHKSLMIFMLLYATVSGWAHVSRTLLMATNQHFVLGIAALAVAIGQLVCMKILGDGLSLDRVGLILLLSELSVLFVCLRLVRFYEIGDDFLKKQVVLGVV